MTAHAALVQPPFARRLAPRRQLVVFAAIGLASTVAYVALFAGLRPIVTATVANAIALLATTIANTAANRRLTFGIRGRAGLGRDHAAGLAALGAALAITTASLAALDLVAPHPAPLLEIAVLVVTNAVATLLRFVLLRRALHQRPATAPSTSTERARP